MRKPKWWAGLLVGLLTAGTVGVIAQTSTGISGSGVTGGGGASPAGSTFATQYKATATTLGGTGPGSANQVLTSNGAGSAPTYQALSATNITAGTLAVARGGTNLTAAADDNVMIGNATTWETKAVPNCTDTGGQHLNYTASTNTLSCGTSGGSTGTTVFKVVKTADTTRTNTTTPTDDPDLTFASVAAGNYTVTCQIRATNASATPDIKFNFTSGTVTTSLYSITYTDGGVNYSGGVSLGTGAPFTIGLPAGGNGNIATIAYNVITSTTATLAFQWSQNTADAVNGTVLKAGSSCVLM